MPVPSDSVTLKSGRKVLLADLPTRFMARLIDSFIVAVGLGIAAVVLGSALDFSGASDSGGAGALVAAVFVALPALGYEPATMALFKGRTLGKMITCIRVAQFTGGDGREAMMPLVRWIVPFAVWPISVVVSVVAGSGWVLVGGLAAWMLMLLSSMWDDNAQGWHDRVAGTVVIKEPPPAKSRHKDPSAARVTQQAQRWR